MNKIGVITEVQNDIATVMIAKAQSCGNCGCGKLTRKDGEMCQDDKQYVKVKNTINGEVGDPVNIEFKTGRMISTSILIYLIPLIMMIVGIILANRLQGENSSDIISFIAGIASLIVSYLILSLFDKSKGNTELITVTEFKGL